MAKKCPNFTFFLLLRETHDVILGLVRVGLVVQLCNACLGLLRGRKDHKTARGALGFRQDLRTQDGSVSRGNDGQILLRGASDQAADENFLARLSVGEANVKDAVAPKTGLVVMVGDELLRHFKLREGDKAAHVSVTVGL